MTTAREGKPGREQNCCDHCHEPMPNWTSWYRAGDPRIFCSHNCLEDATGDGGYAKGYADGYRAATERLPELIRQALREEREVSRYGQ